MSKATRAWCATYAWPDRKPFTYGTVHARYDAPQMEIEKLCLSQLAEHLPNHLITDPPRLIRLVPGVITFQPEEVEA